MNLWWPIYALLTFLIGVLGAPFLAVYFLCRPKRRGEMLARLGFVPFGRGGPPPDAPRIWVHGSSVGEMNVAASLIKSLRAEAPRTRVLLTAMTSTGLIRARALAEEMGGMEASYPPVDMLCALRRALSAWRPHVVVVLETELWPNMIMLSSRPFRRLLLLNGRMSPRSFGSYLRLKGLFGPALKKFDSLAMILEVDAARVRALGAPPEKIEVLGNAKYDGLPDRIDPATPERIRSLLSAHGQPVLVAGSVRSPEERPIIDVYHRLRAEFPGLLLVIIPRHLDRVESIAAVCTDCNLVYQLRSKLPGEERTAPVVIVDTMGELMDFYSAADVAFVGASLAPLGGQNVLEAAAWGCPVVYGPSMDDFLDAAELLEEAGGGIGVADEAGLFDTLSRLLHNGDERRRRGEAGRRALMARGRVSDRLAGQVLSFLPRFARGGDEPQ